MRSYRISSGIEHPLPERRLVHPQQRSEFLIQCGLRPQPAAVAQRDREAPHLALVAAGVQVTEMTPVHLRLFAGRRFEPANGGRHPRRSLRL
jgi:hypothetical protein